MVVAGLDLDLGVYHGNTWALGWMTDGLMMSSLSGSGSVRWEPHGWKMAFFACVDCRSMCASRAGEMIVWISELYGAVLLLGEGGTGKDT